MNLIPRDTFTDLDSLFEDFFPNRRVFRDNRLFSPQVDIAEHDSEYVIKADLPGLKKDDINLTLEDGVLTLQAEHTEETKKEEQGKVIRRERRTGRYVRSFTVGRAVTEKDIGAKFENGVLTLTIPKKETPAAEKRKRISIGG